MVRGQLVDVFEMRFKVNFVERRALSKCLDFSGGAVVTLDPLRSIVRL